MPMPSATVPTITLVFSSSQRGFWLSPSMYTAARMNATTKVKKAMPRIATRSAFVLSSVFRLWKMGPYTLAGSLRSGLAAGILRMRKLAAAPTAASARSTTPIISSCRRNR